MKCSRCGQVMREKDIVVGEDDYGDPIYNRYAFCDQCRIKKNIEHTLGSAASVKMPKPAPKKEPQTAPPKSTSKNNTPSKKSFRFLNSLIILFGILILLMIAFILLYLNKSKIPFVNDLVSKFQSTASVDTRLNTPSTDMSSHGVAYHEIVQAL